MTLEAQKARITGRIWTAIAESGVDVSALPKTQLDALVARVADGVMQEVDAMLDDETKAAGPAGSAPNPLAAAAGSAKTGDDAEQILWEGRPFLSLSERFVVTNQRVRIISGLVGKATDDIELIRLKDVDHTQGISERIMGIGDIVLRSADPSRPVAVLNNVKDPEQVHEIIRRAMLNARKQHPFIFEQEM
jgi:hypothetical protein